MDPYPLESPDSNRLHAFYDHLAGGRLVTTRCGGCGRVDWPPRGFCPACASDRVEWVELPAEGRVCGFSVQETGMPAGYPRPLVFALVEVAGLRIFTSLVEVQDPGRLAVGMPVRFRARRVTDDPQGRPRHVVSFAPVEAAGG